MSCTKLCVKPSPAQAHCSVCHETFGGVTLFDKHRYTLPDGRRACMHPQALTAESRNGVWRVPRTEEEIAAFLARTVNAEEASQ